MCSHALAENGIGDGSGIPAMSAILRNDSSVMFQDRPKQSAQMLTVSVSISISKPLVSLPSRAFRAGGHQRSTGAILTRVIIFLEVMRVDNFYDIFHRPVIWVAEKINGIDRQSDDRDEQNNTTQFESWSFHSR